MKQLVLLTLVAPILFACNSGEKEKTAILQIQQAKDNSIRIAELNTVKEEEAIRSALKDSLASYNDLLPHQQQALTKIKADLYVANDQLTQLRGSNPDRLSKDREAQVHNQEIKIQNLTLQQISLQFAVAHSQAELTQIKKQLYPTR